ncbi:TetR/AcrR family transcriptional regulator [Williamsia maris]|uniref:Transcriptional regulator, TetR family n=1 Tax=Williamsia maris TaxID=72806 RepID=A0ABT1HF48_9NOCA|nr:TetR/AcrR family transcriptional regulator [Williamsia maris]MCP2175590.1 transcriptional regulator, TetR family [Williamsia maris]
MEQTKADPRARLLVAAESLLLESGFDSVSIRAVCAAAEMNPAAVHYHFGSKERLIAALLESRIGPAWFEPVARLDAESPGVRDIVDAVVGPLVTMAADPTGRLYLHLLSRLVLGRYEIDWSDRWFSLDPFVDMLQRIVPGLSTTAARQRWAISFEVILGQFGDPLAGDRTLSPAHVETLCRFVTAGLSDEAVDA